MTLILVFNSYIIEQYECHFCIIDFQLQRNVTSVEHQKRALVKLQRSETL